MKQTFLINNEASRLVLFFAGWGMDEAPFRSYQTSGSDFMLCYDYRTLDFKQNLLRNYSSITLIAWSMGVWAASEVLSQIQLPIAQSIAINGTPYPIDEKRGISPAIVDGTLQRLNEENLRKFQRRMCGTSSDYRAFQAIAPQRPVEELKEELAAIRHICLQRAPASNVFSSSVSPLRILIGIADRIFLPQNQRNAWKKEEAHIHWGEYAHYDEAVFKQWVELTMDN